MKIRFTHTVLRGALFGVVLMLTACVNSLELATPNGRNRSQDREQAIREAVAYFDNHRALLTRSAEAEPSEEVPFVAGDIVVDWESAVTVANEEKRYTDFTMRKDNRFYLLLEQEGEQMEAVELYSRFASVEDFGLDTMNQYVATYIPDVDYLQTYRNVAHEEGINCEEWYEFSGVVMYTMLSGHYVAAYRYEGGTLTERAFLYDREQTDEENIADFCSVMEGLTLGVAVEQGETRTDIDPMLFGGWGDDIIETAYTKDYSDHFYKAPIPEDYEVVEPEWEKREGTGGGGGGPAEEEEEELDAKKFAERIVKNSLSPSDSIQLHTMLEEIMKDCMGNTLLQEIYDKGTQISITFNSSANNPQYTFTDKVDTITNEVTQTYNHSITLTSNQDFALLHELFHFYQHQVLGSAKFKNAKANYEVEAYLATYMYMDRFVGDSMDEFKEEFKKKLDIGYQIIKLHSKVLDDTSFVDYNECDYFHRLFLDTAKHYSNANNNAPYDDTQTIEQHMQNLERVTIHCN